MDLFSGVVRVYSVGSRDMVRALRGMVLPASPPFELGITIFHELTVIGEGVDSSLVSIPPSKIQATDKIEQ
jgi:hypothetical protein